jgi:phosphatidylglycerophosphate synthase
MTSSPRRPIRARESAWAATVARRLAAAGVKPNQVSVASVVFAAGAGAALLLSRAGPWRVGALLASAAFIQLRLLCNLLDGMIAVEGGLRTKSGEIANDLPDRFADPLVLVPAGYLAAAGNWGPELGWSAAIASVLTAYVRVLGGSVGLAQDFTGPMAKQHRMAVMTAACLLEALAGFWGWSGRPVAAALVVVVLGCGVTVVRRTRRIVRALESR